MVISGAHREEVAVNDPCTMIYSTKSGFFQTFLSSGKHTPTTEEVIDALKDLKQKMPSLNAEALANQLRVKHPHWVLDELNWVELQDKLDI